MLGALPWAVEVVVDGKPHGFGSDVAQAGLDGFHAYDLSWCDSQHGACVDIVDAVLKGLSAAGYVIVVPEVAPGDGEGQAGAAGCGCAGCTGGDVPQDCPPTCPDCVTGDHGRLRRHAWLRARIREQLRARPHLAGECLDERVELVAQVERLTAECAEMRRLGVDAEQERDTAVHANELLRRDVDSGLAERDAARHVAKRIAAGQLVRVEDHPWLDEP